MRTAERQRSHVIERRAAGVRPRQRPVDRLGAQAAHPAVALVHLAVVDRLGCGACLECPATVVVVAAAVVPGGVRLPAVGARLTVPERLAVALRAATLPSAMRSELDLAGWESASDRD